MTNQLTPYQMMIWREIRAGGHLIRQMPIRARKRTRIKLVDSKGNPKIWVKSSCLYRLINLNRLTKEGEKYLVNPKWHGNCKPQKDERQAA